MPQPILLANEFLDRLEQSKFAPGKIVDSLRTQVQNASTPITSQSLARILIDKHYLTPLQAQQLLGASAGNGPAINGTASNGTASNGTASNGTASNGTASNGTASNEMSTSKTASPPAAAVVPIPSAADSPKPPTDTPKPRRLADGAAPLTKEQARPAVRVAAAAPSKTDSLAQPGLLTQQTDDDLFGSPSAGSDDALFGDQSFGGALAGMDLNSAALNSVDLNAGTATMPSRVIGAGSATGQSARGLWLGLAGAGVAVLLGLTIWWLTRSNGDAQWAAASKLYEQGSDAEAVEQLAAFAESYPRHAQAGLARVYQGGARLRLLLRGTTNWPQAFDKAKSVLTAIENEPELRQIHPILATTLPKFAIELTAQAQAAVGTDNAAEKAARAEQALLLAEDDRLISPSLRPWSELQTASDQLASVQREAAREQALLAATQQIAENIRAVDLPRAWSARQQLGDAYLELQSKNAWRALGEQITAAERSQVRKLTADQPLQRQPAASPITASVTFAVQYPPAGAVDPGRVVPAVALAPTAAVSGSPTTFLIDGTVYAVDAATGRLLWRRYVGLPASGQPALRSVAIGQGDRADLLVIDHDRSELLRLSAATGELVWRLPLGSSKLGGLAAGAPIIVNDTAYQATADGLLHKIPLSDQANPSSLQCPGRLAAGVAYINKGRALALVGERGSMFVIDPQDMTCRQAIYLGHAIGAIQQPPVVMGEHLLVIENRELSAALVHVLSIDTATSVLKPVQTMSVAGPIVAGALQFGPTTLLQAIDGRTTLLTASTQSGQPPLVITSLVKTSLTSADDDSTSAFEAEIIPWLTKNDSELWAAGDGLRQFEFSDAATAKLVADRKSAKSEQSPQPILVIHHHAGERCAAPPVFVGDRMIVARRSAHDQGVQLSCIDRKSGKPAWQTDIAIPMAGSPSVDNALAVRLTLASGNSVLLSNDQLANNANAHRVETIAGSEPAPAVAHTRDETADAGQAIYRIDRGPVSVVTNRGASELFVYDAILKSDGPTKASRVISLYDRVASQPMFLGNDLLVPCESGQVVLLDLKTGEPAAASFQLPFRLQDQRGVLAIAASPDGSDALVSDGRRIFRVELQQQPSPRLAIAAESEVATALAGPMVRLGDLVFSGTKHHQIALFKTDDLQPSSQIELRARRQWGPALAGESVMVATDDALLCLGPDGSLRWRAALSNGMSIGTLVGDPLVDGESIVVAGRDGVVQKFDRQTGKPLGSIDAGQPLATGVTRHGNAYLVSTVDGTLLKLAIDDARPDNVPGAKVTVNEFRKVQP